MIQEFKNWLIGRGNIGAAKSFPGAINRLSTHYSENTGENIDIYSLRDIDVVNEIARKYRQDGTYSNYGDEGHGLYRCAIAKYSVFIADYLAGNDLSEGILPPPDNDNVICKSLLAKSIEPSSVEPNGRYTNPRTWGVYSKASMARNFTLATIPCGNKNSFGSMVTPSLSGYTRRESAPKKSRTS